MGGHSQSNYLKTLAMDGRTVITLKPIALRWLGRQMSGGTNSNNGYCGDRLRFSEQDIIPGYRIRLPTEKEQEMVVSKVVKKMRDT
ncbi:unnamed protein product [Camellia sinensis]